MVLWWPVGGAKYRIKGRQRFDEHLAYVRANGLAAVVDLVAKEGKPFGADPRGGPWASVLKHDQALRRGLREARSRPLRIDRRSHGEAGCSTATPRPGAEPEDLMKLDIPALVVPGHDESHATSAARYLEECLPRSEYWDVPVEAQTADNAPGRVLEFLQGATP